MVDKPCRVLVIDDSEDTYVVSAALLAESRDLSSRLIGRIRTKRDWKRFALNNTMSTCWIIG